MTFTNPLYLWGLLGLVVPVAIHLWSKKEGKTIKIGSIQLLAEANPKQASSIQLNEWFLLFLRLLLLTLLVFIMAGPQLRKQSTNADVVYLVEPALLENIEIRAMIDSLPEEKIYLLQEDFPKWKSGETGQKSVKTGNYWQLAQEMGSLNADSMVVFTRALLQGINGKRPSIRSKINWLLLNPETVLDQLVFSMQKNDSIELVYVNSTSEQLNFYKKRIKPNEVEISAEKDSISFTQNGKIHVLPFKARDTIHIQIAATDSLENEKKYIEASFRALSTFSEQPIKLTEFSDSINDKIAVLIWLKNDALPTFSGKILKYKSDKFARKLLKPTENPTVFELTESLNSENVISEKLPEQLMDFLDLVSDLKENIQPYDKRSISKNELQTNILKSKNTDFYALSVDLSPWFWSALILLLITERLTAYYRKQ